MAKRLTVEFFERSPVEVAKDLLGKTLVRKIGKKRYAGIISETGAYSGIPDKKSFNYDGMLQEPGRIHIFKHRGNYSLNISSEKIGKPSVVHISKLIPTEGIDKLLKDKNISKKCAYRLTDGPGKLTKTLGIDEAYNGRLITGNNIWIEGNGVKSKIEKVYKKGLAEICLGYYHLETNRKE